MKRIVLYCISILCYFMTSCNDDMQPKFEKPAHATVSIAHLKSLCKSSSTTITDDVSIVGYVITNDLYGEYVKSIIIGDESDCIEVIVNHIPTATYFPISAKIEIHCTGLALGTSGGKVVLGAQPTAEYRVDYITPSLVAQHFRIDCNNPFEITPLKITIPSLSANHIGKYVALNDITFDYQAGLTWCDIDTETNQYTTTFRTLYDRSGNSLQLRILDSCHYCHEKIPSGYGTVWGVVEYFDNTYFLRIVNHSIAF